MGNIHLVTGYLGKPHVRSDDVASFNSKIIGSDESVLDGFTAQIVTNNKIKVEPGEIMMQGRFIRSEESVDLTIENGEQGKKRTDLIVARYIKSKETGIEDVNLVVIKGTFSDSYTDPKHTHNDLLKNHSELNEMPLYRVKIDGLNVQPLEQLFKKSSGFNIPTKISEFENDSNYQKLVVEKIVTLRTDGWDSNNCYTLEDSNITADSHQEFFPVKVSNPPSTQDKEYLKFISGLKFADAGQSNGKCFIYTEKKPYKDVQLNLRITK